jgi:hypothetical protein
MWNVNTSTLRETDSLKHDNALLRYYHLPVQLEHFIGRQKYGQAKDFEIF